MRPLPRNNSSKPQADAQQAAYDLIQQNPGGSSAISNSTPYVMQHSGELDNVNQRWNAAKADAADPSEPPKFMTAKEIRRVRSQPPWSTEARKLYDATQFREAADILRQATVIDPQDENAALFLRLVMTKIADTPLQQLQAGNNITIPLAGSGDRDYGSPRQPQCPIHSHDAKCHPNNHRPRPKSLPCRRSAGQSRNPDALRLSQFCG